ncbi:hypothetical protein H9P43_001646 [Blastocladiella emersonii ATCC 22665]|nr:hypothetical protein H9P43_001646 [Blastocladiella emersonii ATCC 22665]
MWAQKTAGLQPRARGCHLVTTEIERAVSTDLRKFKVGLANIFIQHTSASLTLHSERKDMEMMLNRIVPEDAPYVHTDEGPDDMPGHVKSSLMGASLTIPISNGRLALETWQGIWLCEHRDRGGSRKVVVTLQGA